MTTPISQLNRINTAFCKSAKILRWQKDDGSFTNEYPFKEKRVDNIGWLRSLADKNNNDYFYFMDIDGPGLTEEILEASKRAHYRLKKIRPRSSPFLKASGMSGAHLYAHFTFPHNWSARSCMSHMINLSYTIYKEEELDRTGFMFGPLKKDGLPKGCPGFIDTRVYSPERMIRGFSLHPKSGLYSVPYTIEEDLTTILRRMRGKENMPPMPSFDVSNFGSVRTLMEYKETMAYTNMAPSVDISHLRNMMDENYKGDRYYQSLPDTLKSIVRMKDDVAHDMKWPVVCHLAFYFPEMTAKDMADWVLKRCRWNDLDDYNITLSQCGFSQNWVRKNKHLSSLYVIEGSGKIPLKRVYYDMKEGKE